MNLSKGTKRLLNAFVNYQKCYTHCMSSDKKSLNSNAGYCMENVR